MKNTIILIAIILLLLSCGKQIAPNSGAESLALKSTSKNCPAAPESLKDPQSIEELISLINALPKPLGVDCILKNLKRPIYVNSTSSTLSAQPANGIKSPRIFIFKGNLIVSIVPSGEGALLLEFSELITSTRSIKGELTLPINQKVTAADPFQKINNPGKTSCSGCHNNEKFEHLVDGVPVYSSLAFKPESGKNVMLDKLKYELYLCGFNKDTSHRCLILDSLLSHGDVQSKSFPSEMVTFLSTFGN